MSDIYYFKEFYIPERMMGGLQRYLKKGIAPGHFLSAVLQNDLVKACSQADDENLRNLPAYVGYLYNEAPSNSWGSKEVFDAWLDNFSEQADE